MTHARSASAGMRAGYTLIEILIALGVFLLVLVPTVNMLLTGYRSMQAVDRVTEGMQNREAAYQKLSYEIGLAGYRGVASNFDRPFPDAPVTDPELHPTMVLRREASGSYRILIRYFEDARFLALDGSETAYRSIEYFVDGGQLMRRNALDASDDGVPLVDGVEAIVVEQYLSRTSDPVPIFGSELDADGNETGVETALRPPDDVAGIDITIVFTDVSNTITIGLTSFQIIETE